MRAAAAISGKHVPVFRDDLVGLISKDQGAPTRLSRVQFAVALQYGVTVFLLDQIGRVPAVSGSGDSRAFYCALDAMGEHLADDAVGGVFAP